MTKHLDISDVLDECLDRMAKGESLESCAARHPERRAAIAWALERALELDIQRVEVEHPAVLELALETGITSYDAAYLWLTRRLGASLVTLDAALKAAAGGR